MTTNSGIIVTCVGIIIVARYTPSRKPEPLNRIFVKAYAASEAENSVITV